VLGSGAPKQARGRLPGLDILQLSWNLGLVVNVAVLGFAANIAYALVRMSSGWRQRASGGAVPSLACRGHLFPPRGLGQARPDGRSGASGGLAVRLGCHRTEESGHLRGGAEVLGSGALKRLPDWLTTVRIPLHYQRRSLIIDAAALGLAGSIAYLVASTQIGFGDYGQWLMLSRFYLGQDIPDYRHALAVPPLVPLMLAAIRLVISDPFMALQILKVVMAVGLVTSFFLAGAAIFRDRAAGLFGAILGLLVTDRVLELFAFGGLPQISALVFMALGIAAFAEGSNRPTAQRRWWVLGSLCLALSVLSHAATGTMAIVSGGAVATLSALQHRELTWRQRGQLLAPLIVTLALLAVYWVVVLLPKNHELAANPASLAYRGPDTLWSLLLAHQSTVFILALGTAVALLGGLYEAFSRNFRGYLLAATWVSSAWGMLALSIIAGAATDYPRFASPLVAPLAVAAGGGLAFVCNRAAHLIPRPIREPSRVGLPLALAGLVAMFIGSQTVDAYQREASWYAMNQMEDVVAVAEWLPSHLPADAAVLTTTKEGKWIEGLTGREALFSLPTRFSFRSAEWDRSAAAETLLRSSASITNEFFFVKFPLVGKTTMQDPWISINHGGEYVELVRLPPTLTKITLSSHGDMAQVTLAELTVTSVETSESEDSVEIKAAWGGKVRGATVLYKRTVRLARGSESVDVTDEVTSSLPITALEVEVRPILKEASPATVLHDDSGEFIFPKLGKTQPRLEVSAPVQTVSMKAGAANSIVVRAAKSARLDLQLSAPEPGSPVYSLGLLLPDQLVTRYRVGAAVLARDATLAGRMQRLSALGFKAELELSRYVVMVRDTDAASEVTP